MTACLTGSPRYRSASAFILANTGVSIPPVVDGLITTVAWDLGAHGTRHYALEGSAFVAGAAVQWLRDLGFIDDVTRILQSEAHILQTNVGAALETRIASAIATVTILAIMICGAVCMLCAGILLMHEWLPLWQSFGIAGAGILLIGIASYAIMKSSAGLKSVEL